MALGGKNKVTVAIKTGEDFCVQDLIQARVTQAVQKEVDQCSKDYFRNIEAKIDLTLE